MADGDTIFALASGAGRAAIAILRLSGPMCSTIIRSLCGTLPPARHASVRKLRGHNQETIDQAMVLWFPAPASYTGEDCAELHMHGGSAVIAAAVDALVRLGARPAGPGEFTRRAFVNGKMDLIEAEAVADLIDAETSEQRRQALRQMEGTLSDLYHGWAGRLRRVLAWQEAMIDFPTEDLPSETDADLRADVERLLHEINEHLDDGHRGERLRTGLIFVVAGPPNAGKSSLVNALAGRDVAIVTPFAGTTRDAIEVRMDLEGVPVTLVDTAGLRDAPEPVEAEGIRRARAHMDRADLVVLVQDAAAPSGNEAVAGGTPTLLVANKVDLARAADGHLGVSARTGVGMNQLREALALHARQVAATGEHASLTRARHRTALSASAAALAGALRAPFADVRGEELRLALRHLGQITGAVSVEEVLDTIFGQFCIGK